MESPSKTDLNFKDDQGRDWCLRIKIADADRMRDAGYDPRRIFENGGVLFQKIVNDYHELIGAVWPVIKPQADKLSVTREQFTESFGGSEIEAMGEAFIRAIADFSPAAMRRKIIDGLNKGKEVEEAKNKAHEEAMAKVDVAAIAKAEGDKVTAEIAKLTGPTSISTGPNSSGSVPESSGSTPPHSA